MIKKLLQFLIYLLNRWENRDSLKTLGATRSSHWPKVRKEFLEKYPACAVCGGKEELNVHHIKPFHKYPIDELYPKNLITLCEKAGREHHLNFGHLGSYRSWNENVVEDSGQWFDKIKNRP